MTTDIVPIDQAALMEKVLIKGDLSTLSSAERMSYYKQVCESLGLNPLTRPFQYLTLNGQLRLYATKDCTEQLANNHQVSIALNDGRLVHETWLCKARATTPEGRYVDEIGRAHV